MTVVIDGTTGITTPADSVTGLATFAKGSSNGITIGDVATNSNSVLRMQGTSAGKNWQIANNLNVAGLEFTPSTADGGTTYTTPAMTILSSGNVSIGASSSAYKFTVVNSAATSTTVGANIITRIQSNGSGADANIQFSDGVANAANIGMNGAAIYFAPGGAERARVDGNALTMTAIRLVISGASGIPAPPNNGDGNVGTYAQYGLSLIGKGTTSDIAFFNKNGSLAGYVATGATTITTSSDERLKENNQPITGALDIVCQMRHETGNYKSDPDRQVAFLIAQDVDALFPYAVEKTDPEQMGVNYNWIIPLHGAAITELTALVKEQKAIIEQLRADVEALKAA